jgi:hypothetical protein
MTDDKDQIIAAQNRQIETMELMIETLAAVVTEFLDLLDYVPSDRPMPQYDRARRVMRAIIEGAGQKPKTEH